MVSKDLSIISTSNHEFILHKQNDFSHAFRYGYAIQSDPTVTDEDMDTLKRLFGSDALCSTDCNWVEIYKSCKSLFEKNSDFEHRFRTANVYCDTQTLRMQSRHSGVIHKVYTATQRL